MSNESKSVTVKSEPVSLAGILSDLKIKKRFEEILGKRAAAFTSSILSLYNASPQLQQADPRSIVQSAVIAATLDLPINQNLGFAFIIPYGSYAQFQMGAKGFIQLAIRTAQYKTLNATEVYKDEIAKWDPLTGIFEATSWESWKLREKNDYRDVVGYMAYFKMLNGFEKYLYMTVEQITAHAKRYSKSYDNPKGIWKNNPNAMALKTVLKLLLSKYGLLSIQMEKAIEVDQGIVKPEGELSYDDRPEPQDVPSKPAGADKKINEDQLKLLYARIDKSGIDREEVHRWCKDTFKKEHFPELAVEELTKALKWLEQDPEDQGKAA